MSERIHVLAQQLLGKPSVDECDLEEIKQLVSRYPYFAPAQFLLLEKLKKENSAEYSAQLQKAVLYYHNPLEFEYFISPDRFQTEVDFVGSDQPVATGLEQETPIEFGQASTISPQTANEEGIEAPGIEEAEPSNETYSEIETDNAVYDGEEPAPEIATPGLNPDSDEDRISNNEPSSELTFEPYHTVDYFASQGIKLSQEEVPKDKFGRQLKSFTEWLKTMKRLPATDISKAVDASSESKVQHLAEDSVHQADVVTEAMAEVWIKQGNKEKAIETYNKLGLLNPSKKTYFAALIENLKRS